MVYEESEDVSHLRFFHLALYEAFIHEKEKAETDWSSDASKDHIRSPLSTLFAKRT